MYFDTPLFGDHVLVITELSLGPQDQRTNSCLKRDWRMYTSNKIVNTVSQLLNERYPFDCNDVQSGWNIIENVLITATDLHAPLVETCETNHAKKKSVPPVIRNKLNKRSRFIKLDRQRQNNDHLESIKLLTKEIKLHFETAKRKLVEGVAMGGSAGGKGNIWKAVKIAKNLNTNSLPKNMTLGDTPIATCDTANVFGQFFANKVITL